jgi:3'(2'), 5'-bisphosphate nucleotidase
MNYAKELQIAVDAVRTAAVLCMSVQSEVMSAAMEKRDRSPVTVADFGSQALICRTLRERFPEDPIMAEEDSSALREVENERDLGRVVSEVLRIVPDADHDSVLRWIDGGNATGYSDRFWTLDPIDGTKGFLRGDQYAIALALIVDGDVAVAALGCPGLNVSPATYGKKGDIYAAVRGEGAFVTPLEGEGERTPIFVSGETDSGRARFCEPVESAHSSHKDAASVAHLLGIQRAPLRLDSQAKYAVVACGEAEIYLRLASRVEYVENIWDHAAGSLVIEEAGGRVTDVNGSPLDFRQGSRLERNIGIVATNGHLHSDVLAALAKVLVPE